MLFDDPQGKYIWFSVGSLNLLNTVKTLQNQKNLIVLTSYVGVCISILCQHRNGLEPSLCERRCVGLCGV